MKRKNLLKILILFILAGSIANAEYLKENGEVYYEMPYLEIKLKVKGADAKTFENVGEDKMETIGFFGKDSKNAYFLGKKIKDVSPKEFEILDTKYVKDDKNLYKFETDSFPYFSSSEIKTRKVSIDGLDVKSFKVLENDKDSYTDYYVDKSNVYMDKDNLKKITGADRNSFEILGYSIARDKNNVYNEGEKLENVDIASFKYFDYGIAKDKNRVFYIDRHKDIENADAKTFERMGESYYFRDKNNVFALKNDYSDSNYNSGLEVLKNIDRNSFDILNNEIGKDKNGVYYFGEKIDGIPSNNAKIVEELGDNDYILQSGNDHYLMTVNEKDSDNNERFEIKKIDTLDIDFDTFKYFEMSDLYKDKNSFYYHSDNDLKKIKSDIDVKNAEKMIKLRDFIKDKNNIYHFSDGKLEKINLKIDVNNLEYLDDGNSTFSNYLRDGKNVYFVNDEDGKVKIVKNVDKNTFKAVNGNYGVDSKNVYYLGEKLDFVGLDGLKIFNDIYLKDKKNVYEISINNNDKVKIKPIKNLNIDVVTFENIYEGFYYRDKNAIYYVDTDENSEKKTLKILKGADPSTFELGIISIDKNSVFIENQKLEGVSSKGFEILDNEFNFVKDYKNVYYLDRESDGITYKVEVLDTKGVDIPSFEFLGDFYNKYYKDKNNIYFLNDRDDKMKLEKLNYADPKTFEIINGNFARDDKNLYIFGYKVDGIDPKTFEALNYEMIKDKNGVYFLENISEENENSEIKTRKLNLKGLDLRSFKKIDDSDYYFKDKNSIYYEDSGNLHKIENVDLKTFKDLDYNFAKDKNNIYYKNKKLNGIDAKTFEKISSNIVKDKNGLYFLEDIEKENENIEIKTRKINIKGLDLKTFEHIDDYYYKDKNNVYYESDNNLYKIENTDLKTFEILDSSYTGYGNFSKDKDYIYLNNKKLEEIDAKTFEKMRANLIRDKNGIYKIEEDEGKYKFKIVPINIKIDFKNLKNLDLGYFKDSKNVYYFDVDKFEKIEGAEASSFEKVEYAGFYKDKNYVYFNGKKIVGMDFKDIENRDEEWSIIELEGTWIKYKDNVYYKGKKLKGISSDNFSYFDGGLWYEIILSDKNGVYKFTETEDNKKTIEVTRLDSKGIDLETLERIYSPMDSSYYFKDKNGVYFMDGNKFVKINGADKDSFRVTMTGKYGKDKNNVYFEGKKMEGKNPVDFEEEMEIKQ
ncbi:DKNYY domain-containing protein [Leptotrichia sp. oral taxon 879]|uniref:DKNYY domain-containing protein n=1 Tax=Leptotrichia sp. oral taxon 879 TaxID=1227267 RepID=UPI0003ADAC91|nr:DKNYY domain-containing protein [Leptotrichia sp. oral taxon 879]ERK55237.1 hypothetical protein HMPREF1552_00242 [Leptotrichia sp. oral taxon 879 str. F0557]